MDLKELIKQEKHCEDEKKCPNCNDYTLVGVSFQELLLLCRKCGHFYYYDKEKDKIINAETEEQKNKTN